MCLAPDTSPGQAIGEDSDGDREFSLDLSCFEMPHGRGYLVQRVGAVDVRGHGSGRDVFGEDLAVGGPFHGCHGMSLAASSAAVGGGESPLASSACRRTTASAGSFSRR